MAMIEVGDTAPDFTLPTSGDGEVTLSRLRGKTVIVYFYPKDDTPGCTQEAIDFSRHRPAFDAIGAKIIGISKDSVAKHDKFVDKHDLRVTLAADVDGAICEAYGVWVEKKLYGRAYMGIDRSTFLIDKTGTVQQIWRKVRVRGHAEEVLAAAKAL